MRKVGAPVFQILLRHHDDGRAAQGAGWANDAFADGTEHAGFRNVQKAAQFAHADERQNVTGFFDLDSHNAEVGVSTRTKRTIPLLIDHRSRLSFRVIYWAAREAGGQLLPLCSFAFPFRVTHQPESLVVTAPGLPPGLVEGPGDPLVDIPVPVEGDVFDERLPALC